MAKELNFNRLVEKVLIFGFAMLLLVGITFFNSRIYAASRGYSVEFSGQYVSGLNNGQTFNAGSGLVSVSAGYHLEAPNGSPNTRTHEVGIEYKYQNSIGLTFIEGGYTTIAYPSIYGGSYTGTTVNGTVSWSNRSARSKAYFVTYNQNYGPSVYVIGSGSATYPNP